MASMLVSDELKFNPKELKMKMRILMVAILAALASRVALAASEGGDTPGSNVHWQPPFGGQATISSDVASARTASNVYWRPPFGGQATISSDVASARTGSNVYWQPPFGGQATISAGAASTHTSSNDYGQPPHGVPSALR
jgi:hypothetical protein